MRINVAMSKDFKRMQKALKNGPATLRKRLKQASMYIGKKGEAIVREGITSGNWEPNAPLTVALKGANEPLKGDGTGAALFKAVTSTVVDDYTVFVGILRKDDDYNIAVAIHEGATIPVTEKMRNMFYVLWLKEKNPSIPLEGRAKELWEKMSSGWKPLKASTTAIKIPSRPFITKPLSSPEFQSIAKKIWEQAMEATFREVSQ